MTLDELTALHSALTAVLAWPDSVRDAVAQWLTPSAAKPGNGLDRHPPPIAATGKGSKLERFAPPPRRSPTPYAGKARAGKSKAAEQRLLAVMRESPGASVAALAKAASASRSRTGDRLRALASRGAIVKDGGRWRLKGDDAARPPDAGSEPRPPQPPAS